MEALPAVSSVVYKAVKSDHDHHYGLVYPVSYGKITTDRFKAVDFDNGVLVMKRLGDDSFDTTILPFEPDSGIWDGTSNLPDKGTVNLDALFRASLGHDVFYKFAKDIAKAAGCRESDVLAFADDFLKLVADGNGCSGKTSSIVYRILRMFGGLYHRVMRYVPVIVLATSCEHAEPSIHTHVSNTNPSITWYDENGHTNVYATPGASAPSSDASHGTSATSAKIVSFGSPNCANAVEDPNTQIKDLKMDSNGLSYRWAKGSLRNWGVSDDHDHTKALAVAGYFDGERWRFAKFDWISTDRLTRSFENIRSGYNGWNSAAFFGSKSRGFFIMSEDGRRRTNVIYD